VLVVVNVDQLEYSRFQRLIDSDVEYLYEFCAVERNKKDDNIQIFEDLFYLQFS
jgi:hypothetical protein